MLGERAPRSRDIESTTLARIEESDHGRYTIGLSERLGVGVAIDREDVLLEPFGAEYVHEHRHSDHCGERADVRRQDLLELRKPKLLLGRCVALNERTAAHACLLLDVGDLVRKEPPPLVGPRRKLAAAENDVITDGERICTQCPRGPCGVLVGVNPHVVELLLETCLQGRPDGRLERAGLSRKHSTND